MQKNTVDNLLNTVSHSIYSEVKRIIPDAIPHFIVEEKIGKLIKPDCLEDQECVEFVKSSFGESIIVSGYIKLVYFKEQYAEIKVEVYNTKTGEIKEFHYGEHAVTTYDDLVHDLIKGVMQEKGLLDYIETM